MLQLMQETYPEFAGQPKLLMFSDEDRAFLKSTREMLPNAKSFICIWHKMKNVRRKRALRGSEKATEKGGVVDEGTWEVRNGCAARRSRSGQKDL